MTVHVVAGALIRDGSVLLGHRHASRAWYPDVWDLPGGHVEPGESSRATLDRELREELGVQVRVADGPVQVRLDDLSMDVWRVRAWAGTPANRAPEEHDEVRWFTAGQLSGARLAHPAYLPRLTRMLAGPTSPTRADLPGRVALLRHGRKR